MGRAKEYCCLQIWRKSTLYFTASQHKIFPDKPPFTWEIAVKQFVSYLRVSTHKQGEQGLGIEAQREAVHRYIASGGGSLLQEHVEVETGRLATRPVLLRAIAECKRRRACLVIARLDRLARSVSFISSMMDGGVDFVAVDMPQANRLMLHMLAAFAEFERDQIAARTKAALAAAKARGVRLGLNGQKLADDHKAGAVNFAASMRFACVKAIGSGSSTLATIATHLNEAGYRTREGAGWSPSTVQRLLLRLDLTTTQMAYRPVTSQTTNGGVSRAASA